MNNYEQPAKHFWLYVLKLEQDKFYVGITTKTPEERMKEHVFGYPGARWTKKYKPLAIYDRKDLGVMTWRQAEAYENKIVRLYMKKLGVNRTRGGDITNEDDHIARFGYIFKSSDYEALMIMTFMVIIIIYLFILYYFKL